MLFSCRYDSLPLVLLIHAEAWKYSMPIFSLCMHDPLMFMLGIASLHSPHSIDCSDTLEGHPSDKPYQASSVDTLMTCQCIIWHRCSIISRRTLGTCEVHLSQRTFTRLIAETLGDSSNVQYGITWLWCACWGDSEAQQSWISGGLLETEVRSFAESWVN